jgi:hypothetical protein
MALPIRYKIVETDNFGGDYPNEQFVNIPATTEENARKIAFAINHAFNMYGNDARYWIVKPEDYKLQPGFEP